MLREVVFGPKFRAAIELYKVLPDLRIDWTI